MPRPGTDESGPLVAVLAAGAASRFGGGKLDAMLAGKPVGQWVLDAVTAVGLAPGMIVVGSVTPRFAGQSGWPLLVNDRAEQGLGTSLALAAGRALVQGRALLVVLADMPLVDPDHLRQLTNGVATAATLWPQGKAGVPAHFTLADLPLLASLSGDAGAGAVLAASKRVAVLAVPPQMLLDVDTPDDLARAEQWLRRG